MAPLGIQIAITSGSGINSPLGPSDCNLLRYSEDITNASAWDKTTVGIGLKLYYNPYLPTPFEGTYLNQIRFKAVDPNLESGVTQLVSLKPNTEYTFSFYNKAATNNNAQYVRVVYWKPGAGVLPTISSDIDLGTDDDTYFRYTYTFTTYSTGGDYRIGFLVDSQGLSSGNYMAPLGYQLNEGNTADEYAYTQAATVCSTSPLTPITPRFLDTWSGGTLAYSTRRLVATPPLALSGDYGTSQILLSLRKVKSSYTIDRCVNVRRSSDDSTSNIGFDSSGSIDTTALTTFVNSGEAFTNSDITSATGWTLGSNTTYNASTEAFDLVAENGLTVRQGKNVNGHTFAITIVLDSVTSGGIKIYAGGTQSAVISTAGTHTLNIVGGSSNDFLGINPNGTATCSISSFSAIDTTADGHVTTWYDQSGNGQDVSNGSASQQPLLVEAGVVLEKNERPAIKFSSTEYLFREAASTSWVDEADVSIFTVFSCVDFGHLGEADKDALYNISGDEVSGGNGNSLGAMMRSGQLRVGFFNQATASYGQKQGLQSPPNDTQLLVSSVYNSDNRLTTLLNNSEQGNVISNPELALTANTITVGATHGGLKLLDGTVQELLFMSSDETIDRPKISYNINSFYGIYDGWEPQYCLTSRRNSDNATRAFGFAFDDIDSGQLLAFVNEAGPVLDDYAGAAAAYSLRKVRTAYTGSAIKVRRSSDDALQDIGFDANGDLDTTALTTFVNEDYNHYTSDWSSDVDGWTVNNAGGGTVTLSNDTNRLKVDVSGMTTTGLRPALNFPATIWSNITEGCSATITIEGSNLVVDGLFVDGTFQNITDHDLDTGTFTYTFTKGASNTAIIYFNSTGKGDYIGFLESVVVTQTTADGAVTTWYDQSGNGNDATNSTDSEQPLVVSGGTLVTMGGASKPAIQGSTSSLALSTALTPTNFSIIHTSEGAGFVANIGQYIRISDYYRYNIDGNNYTSSDSNAAQQSIYVGNRNGTTLNLRRNGSEMSSSPHTSVTTALNITSIFNYGSFNYPGKMSEIIIFESDQSSNLTGIEGNIGRYYNIDGFADGLVTELSDQTGNMFDGFNVTAGNQPLVVENGQILTNSFIGYSNDYLFYGRGMESIIGDFYIDIDFETGSDITTRQTIFGTRLTSGERAGIVIEGGRLYIERFTSSIEGGRTPSEGGILANTRYKATLAIDATSSDIYLNGVQSFEANPVNWLGFINVNSTIIGASRPANVEHKFLGKVKTLIVFQGRPTSEHISAFNNYD